MNATPTINTVEELEERLSRPTEAVVELVRRLEGDFILLGVAGKIGPSLARMIQRASDLAGVRRRVIGVSRFSTDGEEAKLRAGGIETIRCDLLDEAAITKLPEARHVIYLAGMKFGSTGQEAKTWVMNCHLPSVVCRKFARSRIVAYSTGAVYGLTSVTRGGSLESDPLNPVGEYAMSCVGRERMFQHFGGAAAIPTALLRLFYACELRYGVLVDIAHKLLAGEPIELSMGHFNIIWQGDANAMALLAFDHLTSPPLILNLTGPEILSVREVAQYMGRRLGKTPIYSGVEQPTACLGNAQLALRLFGPPQIRAEQLIDWVAEWVKQGGATIGKPTHFETRDGRY